MLTHVDDLESDLSRFHRIDDLRVLPFPRFYRLACRVWLYGGVMAAVHRQAHPGSAGAQTPAQGALYGPQSPAGGGSTDRPDLRPIPGLRTNPAAQYVPVSTLAARSGGELRRVRRAAG